MRKLILKTMVVGNTYKIAYKDKDGIITVRIVQVNIFNPENHTINAWCYLKDNHRTFRLENILMIEEYDSDYFNMLRSFRMAIDAVGGCSASFVNNMDTMTVQEMFETLAPNGVRFTVQKDK